MIVRNYDNTTVITPTLNRGVLYGVLNCGVTEVPEKEISLKDLKDVELGNLDNDDALMYDKDTEKWVNQDLDEPVGESVNKYLSESVIDGGGVPLK